MIIFNNRLKKIEMKLYASFLFFFETSNRVFHQPEIANSPNSPMI